MTSMNSTPGQAERLQRESIGLQDATARTLHLVETLGIFIDEAFVAPAALPLWLAGKHQRNEHATLTPENQGAAPAGLSLDARRAD